MNRRRVLQLLLTGTPLFGACGVPCATLGAGEAPRGAGREQRPAPRQMRVETLPPDLLRILKEWERESAKFKKLYGEHRRYVYDSVFQVEKRSIGRFWFEAPDMGRIDIQPDPAVKPGAVNPKKVGKDGKPYTVQPDKEQQWVSNGEEVIQVNTDEKTIEIFPIPDEIRGENIVDSPLPFLFGMKAEKAQRRYKLSTGSLHDPQQKQYHLIAYPRDRRDARNWSRAEVLLDATTFFPMAIKLIDPGGNSETVFRFHNVHEPRFFEQFVNPFQAERPGFKRIVHAPPQQRGGAQPGQKKMPRLIGLHWKKTKELLEQAGYSVKLRQGQPAPKSDLVYHIYRQSPPPEAPLKKEVPIVLTLYVKPQGGQRGPTNRTSAKPSEGPR